MGDVLVAGTINLEVTLAIEQFPLASYKIGVHGSAEGFLDRATLDRLAAELEVAP